MKPKAIPQGMHSVTPHLICAGAANAIEFYKKAFGATEKGRLPAPDGRIMHAAIGIGDSTVMLVDEMPEWGALGPKALKGSPVTIHIYVDDRDRGDVEFLKTIPAELIYSLKFMSTTEVGVRFGPSSGPGIVVELRH